MKPILCVLDLSGSSATVFETAVRIALAFKTHLIIIFPYRLIGHPYTENLSALNSKLINDAKLKFSELKQLGEIVDQLSYEFRAELGFPADRISSFLKEQKAEMIVMGQQQATSVNELNSTGLQDLITSSQLPFTIVPDLNHTGLPF